MKELVIFGSWKEAAQVVFDINDSLGHEEWRVVAIADENPELWNTTWHGIPIVEAWSWLEKKEEDKNAICCVGKTQERKRICMKLKNLDHILPNIISPRAMISEYVGMGEGNLICADVQIHPDAVLGNCNMINVGSHIAHDVKIGDYCNINSNVNLVEKCIVGDMAYIGAGCTVIKGVRIGENCTVGAMAMVNKDIPDGEIWGGIPARPLNITIGDKSNE